MVRILKIALLLVLLLILVGPFLVPVPPLEGVQPVERLGGPDSRFMEIDGIQVHYQDAGQAGRVFILLHGFASSLFSWREVIPALAEQGRVIAFDRPAFGLTERPLEWEGQNPYSQQAQVELTIKLMDRLGVDQAILVGNSAGGEIAALTALAHPERVTALVLVDPAIYREAGTLNLLKPLLHTPQARRLGPLFVRSIQNWGLDFARSAWHDPSRISEAVWEGYLRPLQAENWDRGLWELVLAGRQVEMEERLDELELPVLVITGDDDRIIPTEQSIRLAGELADARLVVIPNCGHVPHEECPQAFLRAVDEFLAMLPENWEGQ